VKQSSGLTCERGIVQGSPAPGQQRVVAELDPRWQ